MSTSPFAHLARVSDEKLIRALETLLARERRTEAEVLAHIAEVDARKLYVERGFDSMYRYCVEELRLSDGAAFHRIHGARAARRFPLIFEMVADGRMNLSGIVLLAPHLTDANHARLLQAAAPCSKREIEELVATLFPKPATPASVERVAEEFELPGAEPAAPARSLPRRRASLQPVRPWARHERHRAGEITLRCRAHNGLAAREEYGATFMERFSGTVPGDRLARET